MECLFEKDTTTWVLSGNRNNVVGVVTMLQDGQSRVQILAGKTDLFFSPYPEQLRADSASYSVGTRFLSRV
jgi:hypothetical protein